MAIKNQGIDVDEWDSLLSHVLLEKMPKDTIKDYGKSLENLKEIQKTSDLLEYIEKQFLALDSAEIIGKSITYGKSPRMTGGEKTFVDKSNAAQKCGYFGKR